MEFLPEEKGRSRYPPSEESSSVSSISRPHSVNSTTSGSESETRSDIFTNNPQRTRSAIAVPGVERYRHEGLTGTCSLQYGESKTGEHMATPSGQQVHPSDAIEELQDNIDANGDYGEPFSTATAENLERDDRFPEEDGQWRRDNRTSAAIVRGDVDGNGNDRGVEQPVVFHRPWESGNITINSCILATPIPSPSASSGPQNRNTLPGEMQLSPVSSAIFSDSQESYISEISTLDDVSFDEMPNIQLEEDTFLLEETIPKMSSPMHPTTDTYLSDDDFYATPFCSFEQESSGQPLADEKILPGDGHEVAKPLNNRASQRFAIDNLRKPATSASIQQTSRGEIEDNSRMHRQLRATRSWPTEGISFDRQTLQGSPIDTPPFQHSQINPDETQGRDDRQLAGETVSRITDHFPQEIKGTRHDNDQARVYGSGGVENNKQIEEIQKKQQSEIIALGNKLSDAKKKIQTLENKLLGAEKTNKKLCNENNCHFPPENNQCYQQQHQTCPTREEQEELTSSYSRVHLDKIRQLEEDQMALKMENLEIRIKSLEKTPNPERLQTVPHYIYQTIPYQPCINYIQMVPQQIYHMSPCQPVPAHFHHILHPAYGHAPYCQPILNQLGPIPNIQYASRQRNNKRGTPKPRNDAQPKNQ